MSDECKCGFDHWPLPCKNENPPNERASSSLAAMPGSASYDDWQVAYEEAAEHLEYLSGISTDQTDGERDAQRKLAARLRASAKRITPNS